MVILFGGKKSLDMQKINVGCIFGLPNEVLKRTGGVKMIMGNSILRFELVSEFEKNRTKLYGFTSGVFYELIGKQYNIMCPVCSSMH